MEQELKEILLSMQSELKAMKEAQEHTNTRLETMEKDIVNIKDDIVTIKDDISELKEDTQVTREAVNTLLDWAEKAQVQVKIPLFQKAE